MTVTTIDTLVPLYINGKITTGKAAPFEVVSPWTDKPIHSAENASVDQALQAAEAAGTIGMKTWAKWAPSKRREILLKAAEVGFTQLSVTIG